MRLLFSLLITLKLLINNGHLDRPEEGVITQVTGVKYYGGCNIKSPKLPDRLIQGK